MKKIILDLDTGIDDTLAMSYVLASEDAELIGITGTYGNVLLETGVANDLNLLSMFGREDIPVFKGVSHPSNATDFAVPDSSGIFHGKNGTGNVYIPTRALAKPKKRQPWISSSTAHASTAKTNSCTFPPARPPISTQPSPKLRTSSTTSPS